MKRCPLSYDQISDHEFYSKNGLKQLSPRLKDLKVFDYSAEQQREEAVIRSTRMSIQGVQHKISAKLNTSAGELQIVDQQGSFIIKPQSYLYKELPENEDLTMRLAKIAGLKVPIHGLIYCKDKSFSYLIKRFDRLPGSKKVHVEDFAQLAGRTRDTKYDYSMEKVADLIDKYCSMPYLEMIKLWQVTVFNYLCGNEDMHLKNFSIINNNGKYELAPLYDLINTTIELGEPVEEIALPLDGRKKNLTRKLLIDYFAMERLELNRTIIDKFLNHLEKSIPDMFELIEVSFLSDTMKLKYQELLTQRAKVLWG